MKVCVLWHMHQPDYRLPGEGGRAAMPWVRLHAAHDYLDMALLAEEAPANVHVTFNVTPCLLEQLADLAEGRASDPFLDVARKDAKDLNEGERRHVLDNFFSVNDERRIRPIPRYLELRERRDQARRRGRLLEAFTDDDLRDLVVLFHLGWSGQRLRREELVQTLVGKGRGYREDEKRALLALQDAQARTIIPLYARLAKEGRIEVSTTPLYHPILPLLCDLKTAEKARPGTSVGSIDFRYPDDARMQVKLGLDRVEAGLGVRPRGMWPSEGSVSEEVIALLAANGVQWIATDEQILRKSQASRAAAPHLRPYRVRGQAPAIFFRDTGLSDLIGFTYAHWDAKAAADDMLSRIGALGRSFEGTGEPIVPIILDGENAWESYVQSGEPFLRAFYQRLGEVSGIEATTFSRALEAGTAGTLDRLEPGSWIYGNLDTWAGHPEKNRAWQLLSQVRREVADASSQGPISAEAREYLLRAEGSDWFWWLGDDHPTPFLAEFDSLFRRNLEHVCRRLGRPVLAGLEEPIAKRSVSQAAVQAPFALITPVIDGLEHRYYDWIGAGIYHPLNEGGAMRAGQGGAIQELRFGFDRDSFYLCVVPRARREDALGLARVRLTFESPVPCVLEWKNGAGMRRVDSDQNGWMQIQAAWSRVLEIGLPRSPLGLAAGMPVRFGVDIFFGDGQRERLPLEGTIELVAPDDDFDLRNWTL